MTFADIDYDSIVLLQRFLITLRKLEITGIVEFAVVKIPNHIDGKYTVCFQGYTPRRYKTLADELDVIISRFLLKK